MVINTKALTAQLQGSIDHSMQRQLSLMSANPDSALAAAQNIAKQTAGVRTLGAAMEQIAQTDLLLRNIHLEVVKGSRSLRQYAVGLLA